MIWLLVPFLGVAGAVAAFWLGRLYERRDRTDDVVWSAAPEPARTTWFPEPLTRRLTDDVSHPTDRVYRAVVAVPSLYVWSTPYDFTGEHRVVGSHRKPTYDPSLTDEFAAVIAGEWSEEELAEVAT